MSSTNNLGSWIVRPVIATPSLILFVCCEIAEIRILELHFYN